VRCQKCDIGLTASLSTGKTGARHPYYHCRNRHCHAVSVRKEVLEASFLAWLDKMSVPAGLLDLMSAVAEDLWAETQRHCETGREALERSLRELETKKDRLVDVYLAAGIDEDTFCRQSDKIEVERIDLREQISSASMTDIGLPELLDRAREILTDLPSSWNSLEPLQRQPFLRAMVPAGLTYANGVVGTLETPWCIKGIEELTSEISALAVPTLAVPTVG
jgi:hypothetical protein